MTENYFVIASNPGERRNCNSHRTWLTNPLMTTYPPRAGSRRRCHRCGSRHEPQPWSHVVSGSFTFVIVFVCFRLWATGNMRNRPVVREYTARASRSRPFSNWNWKEKDEKTKTTVSHFNCPFDSFSFCFDEEIWKWSQSRKEEMCGSCTGR